MKACLRTCLLIVVSLPSAPAGAQVLATGWSSGDIGAVGRTGSASGDGTAFTVDGAGADIWGTADAFRYVYTTLTGDGSIVTRVTSVEYVANWTKAGVMMRDTLSPEAKQAMMLVSAGKGLAFQRRVSTNGISTHTSGGDGHAPAFVRLTRTGNVFQAATSLDGATWSTVGSETITMGATIYVGLAVSSHVAGTLATATFASTALTGSIGTSAQPIHETIVIMRHGEKPSGGYGQITCQGLQRALRLPDVLLAQFGQPEAIFAPSPLQQVTDSAGNFYYVRPLATIEPTAIRLGMAVNTAFGWKETAALQAALVTPAYATSTVFVAWEHLEARVLAQRLLDAYGAGVTVPSWPSTDYDSLYVIHLTNVTGATTATFEHRYEGLDGQPTTCP
jgi:hypothetical protein